MYRPNGARMAKRLSAGPGEPLNAQELGLEKLSWRLLFGGLAVLVFSRVLVFGTFQLPQFGGFLEVVGMSPNNAASFASLAILYLLSKPPKNHRENIAILALLLEVWYLVQLPARWDWFGRLLVFGGGIGMAALVGLVHLSFLGSQLHGRRRARMYLRMATVLALYPVLSGAMIGSLSFLTPLVHDAWGYNVEGAIGFMPAFEVAHWQATHRGWDLFLHFIYSRLLIWVLLAFALNQIYHRRCYSNLFLAFSLSGVVGLLFCYSLPMVGLSAFIGMPPWPFEPIPNRIPLEMVAVPLQFPRTCIPSMHTCWILIAYFVAAPISRAWRWAYFVLVVTTLISALGPFVGHYVLDLVAGFPFAVSWQAFSANGTPAMRSVRWQIFLAGLALTLGYCLSIRLAPLFWMAHPYLFWTVSLAIVVTSLVVERHISKIAMWPEATALDEGEVQAEISKTRPSSESPATRSR